MSSLKGSFWNQRWGQRSEPDIPQLHMEPVIDKWRKQVKIFHVGITACKKGRQEGILHFRGKS